MVAIVIRRAYEIVTPESATSGDIGDIAESGWLTADDQQWQGDWKEGRKKSEIRFDSAKKAAEFISKEGAIVGDNGYDSFYFEPHQDVSGAYTSESVHIDATRSEIERIWDHLAQMGTVLFRMKMPFKPVQRPARRVRVAGYRRAR